MTAIHDSRPASIGSPSPTAGAAASRVPVLAPLVFCSPKGPPGGEARKQRDPARLVGHLVPEGLPDPLDLPDDLGLLTGQLRGLEQHVGKPVTFLHSVGYIPTEWMILSYIPTCNPKLPGQATGGRRLRAWVPGPRTPVTWATSCRPAVILDRKST